jgi:hypothetical protein
MIDGISRAEQHKTKRNSARWIPQELQSFAACLSKFHYLPDTRFADGDSRSIPPTTHKRKLQSRRALLIESLEISAANKNKKRDNRIQRILHVA